MTGRPLVVVVGGSGFFGRRLVRDLLEHTDAQVVVASRRPDRSRVHSDRVTFRSCDIDDDVSTRAALRGADVVVHCAGPFQGASTVLLEAAIDASIHYVDISEDRVFARQVEAFDDRARTAGVAVLNGCSVVPGMEALVARMLSVGFDELLAVRAFAAPDTRRHRGQAMFHATLYGAGRPLPVLRDGRVVNRRGWSEPEWVDFPPPVGRRLVYLVLEMSDLDVLPRSFGVRTVEFKAGSELAWLNRVLASAARLRAWTGLPRLERHAQALRALVWLVGRFGSDAGAAMFEVTGRSAGSSRTIHFAVVAEQDGGRIPVALAGMAVEELLAGRLRAIGVVPVDSWISSRRLLDGLAARGFRTVLRG